MLQMSKVECGMSYHSQVVAANIAVANDLDNDEEEQITKDYDAVVFDVLRVNAEDIANQLTLIDMPLFEAIEPEELASCSWSTKKKYEVAPNVVNFTRRFNHVSFWVTREILNANTQKKRAEIISHFIRISKRLLELSNLHSLKAIVSGLQSAPIYRLNRTWNLVARKDRDKLEKLDELVSESENRVKLRAFLESSRLPCIPYLGMYLTDLTYINTVHPPTGGLDIQRSNKMNAILRVIADFQQSNYDFITEMPHVQKYLMSVKYIEELQKFMEDDNYKLSLKIEPNSATPENTRRSERRAKSPDTESLAGDFRQGSAGLRKANTMLSVPIHNTASLGRNFIPSHRKARSLGNSVLLSTSFNAHTHRHTPVRIPSDPLHPRCESPGCVSARNLLDDSLIDDHNGELHSTVSFDSGLDHEEHELHPVKHSFECGSADELTPHMPETYFKLQGFLKRKTYLKYSQKPRVARWNRYWVGLTGSCLVYYQPKYRTFGGHERENFRVDPHKVMPLYNWSVVSCSNASHPDLFQLVDETGANVYRFVAGSATNSALWCKHISEAIERGIKPANPTNLISFGESDDDDENELIERIEDTHL
eukprot:Seg2088.3 transcript_id=Seg2088.3/GoldUCD/mRNA.D3Y31 product="Ras-specific guanine nucleotide-releasing factor RalGPS2" protein_id=Seg2088.3/GoldUCD/D3Y31